MGASPVVIAADQFLHGYAEGHRLLAGSTKLPPEAARALLIHSDSTASTSRQLSSLPLPNIGLWALTATWTAPEMPRPGSVWSHTVVVRVEALDRLSSADALVRAFRRPDRLDDLDSYRRPLRLLDRGVPTPLAATSSAVAPAVALALYGWPGENVAVVHQRVEMLEEALLSFWAQQWPALRAGLLFVTRRRVGSAASADIQLARTRGTSHDANLIVLSPELTTLPHRPQWVEMLVDDALRPGKLREFLFAYGPEAARGTRDVPVLVRIHAALAQEPVGIEPIRQMCDAYPRKSEMTTLKHDCLGRTSPAWPRAGETLKLLAALSCHDALEWRALKVPQRVRGLASSDQSGFVEAVLTAWATDDASLRESVIDAAADPTALTSSLLSKFADREPAVAARLAEKAPQTLIDAELWRAPAASRVGLLRALTGASVDSLGLSFGRALASVGNNSLLRAARDFGILSSVNYATVLAEGGATAKAATEFSKLTDAELRAVTDLALEAQDWSALMLAAATSPREAKRIARATSHLLRRHLPEAEQPVRDPVAAYLLAYAPPRGRSPVLRDTFAMVHAALVHGRLPARTWEALDKVLPSGNHWDRAERLRRLLADTIEREDWSSETIAEALNGAGEHAEQLVDLMPKKSDARKAVRDAMKRADLEPSAAV